MDHPMDPVHGPTHGLGPWTTANLQKEIAPVNMKIYRRSGYEKQTRIYPTAKGNYKENRSVTTDCVIMNNVYVF